MPCRSIGTFPKIHLEPEEAQNCKRYPGNKGEAEDITSSDLKLNYKCTDKISMVLAKNKAEVRINGKD